MSGSVVAPVLIALSILIVFTPIFFPHGALVILQDAGYLAGIVVLYLVLVLLFFH